MPEGENEMNHDEIVAGLILEFRRGTLIMVVLAQLNKPMYGYSLVKVLGDSGVEIEGNTLYPLLRRLESQGLLKSEWETQETRPRKYYIITEDGKIVFEKIKKHWERYSQSISMLIEEEKRDE
jgi:DNA-binding PadR family transcriptional regulator